MSSANEPVVRASAPEPGGEYPLPAQGRGRCRVVGQTLEGHHHGCDLGGGHEGFHVCFICRGTFEGSDCYSAPLAALTGQGGSDE